MSIRSSFLQHVGPRVRVVAIDRVHTGLPEVFALKAEPGFFATVSLVRALARRGVRNSVGKDAAEALLVGEDAIVALTDSDGETLIHELADLRVTAVPVPSLAAAE